MPALPSPVRLAPLALALLAAAPPSRAAALEAPEPEAAVVAEALFLVDPLPPGSQDLNLILAFAPGEAGPLTTSPTLQYVAPIGDRAGVALDLALPAQGEAFDLPALSLKYLLLPPGADAAGLSACADLRPSLQRGRGAEAGLGLGLIRQAGPVALRATTHAVVALETGAPALQAGVSAALQLGTRCRLLAELVADGSRAGWAWSAGPTVKVSLAERVAIMGGALLGLGRAGGPIVTVQLTSTL